MLPIHYFPTSTNPNPNPTPTLTMLHQHPQQTLIPQLIAFSVIFYLFILLLQMNQRKHNTHKKQPSQTPTKIAIHSPSKNIPLRSPLTTSKFNIVSNSKSTVSYGQLQIVLDNLQEIRKKAGQQISQLTAQNKELKQQIVRRQHESQELNSRFNKSSFSKHQFESKILEQLYTFEEQNKNLKEELKSKNAVQAQAEAVNVELSHMLKSQKGITKSLEDKIVRLQQKWRWAFDILAADHERSDELIWKVKDSYKEGIWSVLQANSQLNSDLAIKNTKLEFMEHQLIDLKANLTQTTNILEKTVSQLNSLSLKLRQSEEQAALLKQRCTRGEQEEEKRANELKLKLAQSANTISTLQSRMALLLKQKQIDFHDLVEENARLKEQLAQKSKGECFQMLVSQVCEQSEDYSQLLERLRYLQNFKVEHYLNVQKIQYLCKMLDD